MRSFAMVVIIGSALAQTSLRPDPVVLVAGEDKLTASRFERLIAALPQQTRELSKATEGKRQLAEQLAQLLVLAREARNRNLDKSQDMEARIALQTDEALASELYKVLAIPTEAALRAYYEEHASDFEEVSFRQILVKFHESVVPLQEGSKNLTEAEALRKAKNLRTQITGGTAFADVAKRESDHDSFINDGELGFFRRGTLLQQIEDAAFSLPVGGISEPVRSSLGYHLVFVESRRRIPFESAREEISNQMGKNIAERAVSEMKSRAGIQINEAYFGR